MKITGDGDWYDQKRGVDDDDVQSGNLYRLLPFDDKDR